MYEKGPHQNIFMTGIFVVNIRAARGRIDSGLCLSRVLGPAMCAMGLKRCKQAHDKTVNAPPVFISVIFHSLQQEDSAK